MKTLPLKLIKTGLLPWGVCSRRQGRGVRILSWHRVSGRFPSEIELPYSLFQQQLEFLAATGKVVSYEKALELLQPGDANDHVALTFDDGHEDFYTHAFPLLKRLNLPATVFVTTGFVEEGKNYPLSKINSPEIRPVTWEMLAEMLESGLVTIGAHTHTHPNLVHESNDRVIEELARPLEFFRKRLDLAVRHFAYPRALCNAAVETLVRQYYASAAIAGGKKATAEGFNPYRVPRTPIRRSDGWLFFCAKLRGWLEPEEEFYCRLKKFA